MDAETQELYQEMGYRLAKIEERIRRLNERVDNVEGLQYSDLQVFPDE